MNRFNGDWKNVIIGILASLLVAGVTGWATFGRGKITRAEATEIMNTASPYVRDKAVIDELRINVVRLADVTTQLQLDVARLRTLMERR